MKNKGELSDCTHSLGLHACMDSLSGDFESEAEGTGLNRADPQARGFHDEGSIGSKPFEQSSERTDTPAFLAHHTLKQHIRWRLITQFKRACKAKRAATTPA